MPRPLAVALVLLAALPAAAQARPHHHVKRPHLRVAGGTVEGAASGSLNGAFTIINSGDASAPRSTARLSIRTSARKWTSVKTYTIPALRPGARRVGLVTRVAPPRHLPSTAMALRVCDGASCRTVGKTTTRQTPAAGNPNPAPANAPAPTTPTTPAPAAPPRGPPVRPTDTTPPHPIAFAKDTDLHLSTSQSGYYAFVPDAYDATHRTPSELFVWMHGCGGDAQGDLDTYATSGESYIMISLDGADPGTECWNVDTDSAKVLAAIADMEDHFNIDQRRIVIGGYSSGGDLAYRTAFYNAYTFAGLLAENTSPFRDTGSTAQQSIAAAAWKFPIVQLSHTSDDEYPPGPVQAELAQLTAAGWPSVTYVERPGHHYDNNTTDADLEQVLLPYLDAGWMAP